MWFKALIALILNAFLIIERIFSEDTVPKIKPNVRSSEGEVDNKYITIFKVISYYGFN